MLAPAVAVVAAFECVEAFKVLTGQLDAVNRNLISVDVWSGRVVDVNVTGAAVQGDDETARGASALVAVETVEAALGLDRPPPPRAAPYRCLLPPPPDSGSPHFFESFLARVRAQANVDGAFAYTRRTRIYGRTKRSGLCRRRSPPWARRTLAAKGT